MYEVIKVFFEGDAEFLFIIFQSFAVGSKARSIKQIASSILISFKLKPVHEVRLERILLCINFHILCSEGK